MTKVNGQEINSLPFMALHLRALVLALGESTDPAWWNTKFMNEAGLRFLERLYPRTFFHAAIHAAGKAAADVHDRAVGRIGIYHLFRLPEYLETEIHQILHPNPAGEFFPALRNALGQPEELVKLLAPMCGCEGTNDAVGAKKIGTERHLMTEAAMRETASVYRLAFAQKKPGFPYFTTESVGGRG